mmetsp:Transcript_49477/g.140183  ORF Transcript_49477/g.140183 Transcript_49477/m.140183 type:complete len:231 (-) Transcript_49477:1700-2392(-)
MDCHTNARHGSAQYTARFPSLSSCAWYVPVPGLLVSGSDGLDHIKSRTSPLDLLICSSLNEPVDDSTIRYPTLPELSVWVFVLQTAVGIESASRLERSYTTKLPSPWTAAWYISPFLRLSSSSEMSLSPGTFQSSSPTLSIDGSPRRRARPAVPTSHTSVKHGFAQYTARFPSLSSCARYEPVPAGLAIGSGGLNHSIPKTSPLVAPTCSSFREPVGTSDSRYPMPSTSS